MSRGLQERVPVKGEGIFRIDSISFLDQLPVELVSLERSGFWTLDVYGNYEFHINCSDPSFANDSGIIAGPVVNPFDGTHDGTKRKKKWILRGFFPC
ncbi:MAG: hypothetical protein ACTSUE_14820 [Promethearchaeota archaeon]